MVVGQAGERVIGCCGGCAKCIHSMAEATDSMLAKLDELEARYRQIEREISDPEIMRDSSRLIKLSKEQGKLD